jgi:hypothetical protein
MMIMEWIQLGQYNEQWKDLLNMAMSLRFVQTESESQIFEAGSGPGPANVTNLYHIMYWIVLIIL